MEHIDTEATTVTVGIRVPVTMSEQIRGIAQRERNSVAAVCRRLLAHGLETEPTPPVSGRSD